MSPYRYNSHAPVPVEQKLFRVVRVGDLDSKSLGTLRLLAKTQMADHLIDAFWKSDFVDRQIRDGLVRLFGPEPDPALVRLIRGRAPALSPAEVRASLGRLRTTFDFPVVASPPTERTNASPAQRPSRAAASPPPQAPAKTKGDGTPWRHVTLEHLIGADLVRHPFALEHRYRGVELKARVENASRIVFDGVTYDSRSTAGGVARNSVAGPFPGRDIPQTNGWTFWQFRRSDGRLVALDDLRREFYERKIINLPGDRLSG